MRTKRIAPLSLLFLLVGLSAQAASLPIWSRTFVASRDGKSYTVQGGGGNPFYNGARTTAIPITIVPLVFTFADGTVYDPTELDPCSANLSPIDAVLQSPIFQPTPVSIDGVYLGQGQLLDEFQRANFYVRTSPTGDRYHVVLQPTVAAPVAISVPAGASQIWQLGGCIALGAMDWAVVYPILARVINPLLDPSRFTLFISANAVTVQSGLFQVNCCDYGWHSFVNNSAGQPMTYAVADYDSTGASLMPDIMTISHEIAEWLNDPFVSNWSPAWDGGMFYEEVADPLFSQPFFPDGIQMPNGLTYHPQQLAFFSWFYGAFSLGVGGFYSAVGSGIPSFVTPASP